MSISRSLMAKAKKQAQADANEIMGKVGSVRREDTVYRVIPKDSNSGESLRTMTLTEFTAWAGKAARLYNLEPVE